MKKIILILLLFPLFGATRGIMDTETRPTVEQQLQLAKNELNRINSRIDEKLAAFNITDYSEQHYTRF